MSLNLNFRNFGEFFGENLVSFLGGSLGGILRIWGGFFFWNSGKFGILGFISTLAALGMTLKTLGCFLCFQVILPLV